MAVSTGTAEQNLNDTSYIHEDEASQMEVWYLILGIPTFIGAFCGNLGTIIVFYTEPSLSTKASDLIIFNLAIADLGMALFTIPIFQLMVGAYGYWPWGEVPCRVLLNISMVLMFAGVLFIMLMSWDRYLMLALQYSDYLKKQSSKRLKIVILLTWVVATLQAVYEAAIWDVTIAATPEKYRSNYDKECDCPSMKALTPMVLCAIVFSFLPIIAIITLGSLILVKLRKRLMLWKRVGYDEGSGSESCTKTASFEVKPVPGSRTGDNAMSSAKLADQRGNPGSSVNDAGTTDVETERKQTLTSKNSGNQSLTSKPSHCPTGVHTKTTIKKARAQQNRYIKPVLTYVVLVISLSGCTLPVYVYLFYTLNICPDCYDYITTGYFYGILYLNSALNPILYAMTNAKIRGFYGRKYNAMRRWLAG
ncbi:kappa-type opioid receptor-like [Amphiura filiformis]|uniref:kappa-type opioid receptor-like n=1 Tax=Amphiura filiformis TaxID=82378 RepID=UPI003B228880